MKLLLGYNCTDGIGIFGTVYSTETMGKDIAGLLPLAFFRMSADYH